MADDGRDHPEQLLDDKDDQGCNDPFPKDGSMQDQQNHVRVVQQVCEVENLRNGNKYKSFVVFELNLSYLKVSRSTNEGHGADYHDGEDYDEGHPGRVGNATDQAKDSRLHCENPLAVVPRSAIRTNL